MNEHPWDLLGWVLLGFLVIPLALVVLALVVSLTWSVVKIKHDQWRYKRAHAGKLKCQDENCRRIASRRTQNGFLCTDHAKNSLNARVNVSYAFPLDWTRKNPVDE